MITIEIDQDYRARIDPHPLERSAKYTFQHAKAPESVDLTIVITGDAHIQRLNAEYRHVDAPTDVLSFPANFTNPENDTPYLGDVVIAYPQAESQAQAGGHPVEAELQLLVVHGVLHLLDYDHTSAEEKAQMWALQTRILTELGLENMHITE